MTKLNCTPGPWRAHVGDEGTTCECRQVWSKHPSRENGGFAVAEVYLSNGSNGLDEVAPYDPEEANANARLIAAAPDLYNALQGILYASYAPYPEALADWQNEAEKALAKARSGSTT